MVSRFENFVFDPDAAGLLDSGQPVALEPQVFSLLKYLIENRARIVSKEELIDEIWGGRAITDAALNTRIRAVRRALGDDRTQQKFLRTYPKRGFQFVAATDRLESVDAVGTPVMTSGVPARRRARVWAAIPILALVLSGTAWWLNESAVFRASPPPPAKPSIAVLPFDNLSGDPDQDYFADAFTEDLITDLSRIRDAFVIARRSSFTFKGKAVDVKKVASELGVRYVLEGSVRRSGDQVRIKKFSEDYYVQEGYYDNIYVDQEIACCEEQSRCKSHNVDNTDTVFDVDVSLIDVPKTPYQWVMNIPASATVAGPQTFDERSVTYIKWNKDGKKYHGWFDDTYGVAHKVEIHDQDDQLLEKHQFNDLVFNNLQAADFEPPCV